jgi:hypothetical protein
LGKTGEIDVELIIICPPYIVTREEVRTIVELLKTAIDIVTTEHDQRYYQADAQGFGMIEGKL